MASMSSGVCSSEILRLADHDQVAMELLRQGGHLHRRLTRAATSLARYVATQLFGPQRVLFEPVGLARGLGKAAV